MADNELRVKLLADVTQFKKQLLTAEQKLKQFDRAGSGAGKGVKQFGGAVRGAVPAMTSFSQVIQDAPFGIRGVANNITQLTAQFGHLQKNAGGTKNALTAMVGALTGPAGILLAVSAVTSILVSYGDEISDFIFGTDKAAESTDKFNKQLERLTELQGGLGGLSVAATVAAKEAELAGKSKEEQFKASKKFREAEIQILQGSLVEIKKLREKAQTDAIKSDKKNQEERDKNLTKILRDELELEKKINQAKASLRLDDLNEQIRIREAEAKKVIRIAEETSDKLKTITSEASLIPTAGISDALANTDIVAPFNAQKEAMLAALNDFNKKANQIIQGGLTETFTGLGEAIGEAFAAGGNVFQALGQSILMGLGGFLKDFGKLMIQYGTAALAFSKATQALLNPITAGPAAVALIATGVALTAVGAAISSFAKGGNSGGSELGTDFSSGNANFSGGTVSGGSAGFTGGSVVFEIAGTKLVGVLTNTLNRNKALGGADNLLLR